MPESSAPAQSALLFVDTFLPPSHAFVIQQAMAMERYRVEFLASRRSPSRLAGLDRFILYEFKGSVGSRLAELSLKIPRIGVPALVPALRKSCLIHAHFGKNGFVMAPLARAARRPLITTFHGFDATYAGNPRQAGGFNQVRYFRYGRRRMSEDAGVWSIAVSDFVRDRLLALGFAPERVYRHYIGIDLDLFSARNDVARVPWRVACVARFVDVKGHRYVVDALERVVAAGLPVELVMVGRGPLRGEIERLAKSRLPKVTVLEDLSQEAIRDLLASAMVHVQGSITLESGYAEAFGLVNLEAQAVGTPVVAFDSGGASEALLHGSTGFKIVERNVGAMANAIGQLLTDRSTWERFSRRAPAFVRNGFDIRRQTSDLEAFYDDVIARYRSQEASAAAPSRQGLGAPECPA